MATSTSPNYHSSILIVGAGTWGCSTALHLARRGHRDITVLDAYDLPSPISAGNDINKIVEQGSFDSNPDDDSAFVSQQLLHLASQGWTSDPVFMPYYHDTGYIICAHTPDGLEQLIKREMLDQQADIEWLETPEAFRAAMPKGVLTGDFPGWKGGFKRTGAGWVFARGALSAAFIEAERLGVKFITADGTTHLAETTILAAGAQASALLDMKDQLRPTAWTLSHIKMTAEECELYTNLPVLFNIESGFFMEPDAENHELKICDEHPGYCNWVTTPSGTKSSVPFAKHQVPLEAETRVRDFLRDTMPQLSERPFSFARICWCADTPDRNFLIDRHPEFKSLVLAVGGSGHGFMHITSVGGYVADVLEGKMPETAIGRNWSDVQGRRGGPNRVMDFQEVKEWTRIEER
ncbi:fructosyl amine:oxygen oxidoreductase-like protein [Hyaloscypha bicolor E]|uniref:Fructosyl amine:oxygen oxidoreductase-like protein n=1 Tax=Hyaloscypha bicolor E TaxID=1095630 RepID=A0A2J6T6Z3_9HELO|nr:fructosyl amine:oxygen oxidoreductase-like protein [Hyaloscypha bicolor E]PMD58792.1 fructosyl amine:oxygen oxidoreductase-like protein [Hyaloscypha bicolor E]